MHLFHFNLWLDWIETDRRQIFALFLDVKQKARSVFEGAYIVLAFTLHGSQQQYGEDVPPIKTHKKHLAFECEILSMDTNQPASLTVRAYSSLSPAPEQCCQAVRQFIFI